MNTSLIAALLNIVLNLLFMKYIGLYAAALYE
jgi:O-antigen/teichoic acid export membrane protein